jgi:hypothetical protein
MPYICTITHLKQLTMKKVFLTALMVAGLALTSCGSNKTEGDNTTATDSISSTSTETETTTTTDTMAPATTDTTATTTDTVPAP